MDKIQKTMLINQYKILELLTQDKDIGHEYKRERVMLQAGYIDIYKELISQRINEDVSKDVTEEVFKILDMFRALNNSFKYLDDKGSISYQEIEFKGFDSNFESEYYSFCTLLFKYMDYYEESHRRTVDSFGNRMLPVYRRMLLEWDNLNNKLELSLEEIKQIIGKSNINDK